jgi:hypothetical protein
MNTAKDNFYFVEDIMRMLGFSKSKSYKIIQKLNAELEAKGFWVEPGRVSKSYFHERFYCGQQLDGKSARGTGRTAKAVRTA